MTKAISPVLQRQTAQHRTFDARDLMPDGEPVQVVLDDQTYILRITRAGKLILTK